MEIRDLIATVLTNVRLVDLASETVLLIAKEQNFSGNCPFHDSNSESFQIDNETNFFRCYECGEGGDVISYVQKIRHCDFMTALNYLAEKYNISTDLLPQS